jgi:TatD DNase family protein
MIDSHCHIDLEAFNLDRDKVLQSAFKAGITRLLLLGLSNSRFNKLRQLKAQYQQLDIALGLHPYFLVEQGHSKTQAMFDQFLRLAEQYQTQYIAFGEMGLDGSLPLSMDYQRQVLEFQLSVATQFRKPIVLHHRQSHNQLISVLKSSDFDVGGIIHAFSGSYHEALTYIDMGFLIGVGGTITYPRAIKTRNTIQKLPLDKLVLETDSPDMPINGYQGQRNEPSQLKHVINSLSELKSELKDEVINQTTKNYLSLFGLSEN